jgi:hypothetical protein
MVAWLQKKTGEGEGGGCPYIGFNVSTKFLDAQTLWDASMAYNISEHLKGDPEVSPQRLVELSRKQHQCACWACGACFGFFF